MIPRILFGRTLYGLGGRIRIVDEFMIYYAMKVFKSIRRAQCEICLHSELSALVADSPGSVLTGADLDRGSGSRRSFDGR